jgi:hypothetical protein
MITKFRLTGRQHAQLSNHLFPGDGKEAVAVIACGRAKAVDAQVLIAHQIMLVPHAECRRTEDSVSWSPSCALPLLEASSREGWGIVKIHSHPAGYDRFSEIDDESDTNFFNSVYGWMDGDDLHGSAIMLPCGRIFARTVDVGGAFRDVDLVSVAGVDLLYWPSGAEGHGNYSFVRRHAQLFGNETVSRLRRLSIAVVGCSGTGSPLVEMLARLGVGRLVLVDPDRVEDKNLNRIYNATREDAVLKRLKTEVLGRAVARMGLGTEVELVSRDLATAEAVRAVSHCDVVFGCMDGARGRSLL